jgi:hypothetical protein
MEHLKNNLLLLQEGACGPGTAACSNRPLLGFLYEGVEFGFEGGGVGGDVSWFGTHAGAEGETLVTALRWRSEWWRRRPVMAAMSAGDVRRRRRCRRRPVLVAAAAAAADGVRW